MPFSYTQKREKISSFLSFEAIEEQKKVYDDDDGNCVPITVYVAHKFCSWLFIFVEGEAIMGNYYRKCELG